MLYDMESIIMARRMDQVTSYHIDKKKGNIQ